MWFSSVITLFFAATVYAFPFQSRTLSKPPAFFLAGDSTTAAQSWNGGGWGAGFLTTLQKGAFGINYGVNGATTVTYVNESYWATVLNSVEKYQKQYDPYVTIQVSFLSRTYNRILLTLPVWPQRPESRQEHQRCRL